MIFDHTDRTGTQTILVDDATGSDKGIPLSPEMTERLKAAGLPLVPPPRGASAISDDEHARHTVANVVQQDYFADVTTRAILPLFKERDKPFALVYWSRDPDGTQHYQGDSLNSLVPGINGPTSLAAIRNADDDLARIRAALGELGLLESTDIIVVADHGFSTISKASQDQLDREDEVLRHAGRPLAARLRGARSRSALDLPLIDPDDSYADRGAGRAQQIRQRPDRRRQQPIPKWSWRRMAART